MYAPLESYMDIIHLQRAKFQGNLLKASCLLRIQTWVKFVPTISFNNHDRRWGTKPKPFSTEPRTEDSGDTSKSIQLRWVWSTWHINVYILETYICIHVNTYSWFGPFLILWVPIQTIYLYIYILILHIFTYCNTNINIFTHTCLLLHVYFLI